MAKPERRRARRAATNSVVPEGTDLIIGDGSGVHFFGGGQRLGAVDAPSPLIGQAIATVTGEWPHSDDTVAMAVKNPANRKWIVGSS